MREEVFEARRLNQYQLGEPIGSGGMGDVYLAEHRLLKRPCAVKLIRQEAAGDRKTLEGFEREVRSTARLSHPNIIEIFDYGHTNDQTFYYVMEHLNGFTFAELISQFGRQPGGRVAYLLSQAAAGLAEAHASGLIHRDLKPSNIFAAQIGQRFDVVKIFDFGLVKNTRDLQTQGVEIAGTPMYMAPEQIMAPEEIDRRADLYAIGAIGYHLLTGEPPFKVEKIIDLMLSHVNAPVMSPTQLHSDIPTDLEAVVLKCLAKQPCDRFEDAEQLRTAILSCSCAGEWDERKAREWWNSPSTYKGISETYDMRRVK
jgi:serine/threonine-protein kinase